MLQIIRERLPRQPCREGLVWNTAPGGLVTLPDFSDAWRHYPFHLSALGATPGDAFTAVIYSQLGAAAIASSTAPLYKLIRNVAKSSHVSRVSSNVSYPREGCELCCFWPLKMFENLSIPRSSFTYPHFLSRRVSYLHFHLFFGLSPRPTQN